MLLLIRFFFLCCYGAIALVKCQTDDEKRPQAGRIIGGSPVPFGTYPFHGLSPPGNLCGCSLIHPNVAVSAGHCRGLFTGLSIYLGGILPDRTDAVEVVEIIEERVHPLYNRFILDNDIMVLRLARPITSIEPVPWNADPNMPSNNEILTVMGFGVTAYQGQRAETLLEVDVPAIDMADCAEIYGSLTDNMLCAGGEVDKDGCQGDSGSPLLNEDGVMVGIVSTGPSGGCGLEGQPGIYARTSSGHALFQQAICDWSTEGKPDFCAEITPLPTTSPTTVAPSPSPPTISPTETQPFNDECETARFLGGELYDGTTETASYDDVSLCGRGVDLDSKLPGVWFRVVGSGSIMSIDTCGVDSQLFVFDGGSCTNLRCLRGTRGGCDGSPGALLEWSSVFMREYWILAQTPFATDFAIRTKRFVPGPPNIACFLPTAIGFESIAGTTLGGGPSSFQETCGDATLDSFGVWYTFSKGSDSIVTVDTCSSPTEIDTSIVVFDGECNALKCIAGNNDGCDAGSPMSSVSWTAQAGVDYTIFVSGEIGDFVLRVQTDEVTPASEAPISQPTIPLTPSLSHSISPTTTTGRPSFAPSEAPSFQPTLPLAPSSSPSARPTKATENTPTPSSTNESFPSVGPTTSLRPSPAASTVGPSEAVAEDDPGSCSFLCLFWRFITSIFGFISL